MIKIDMLSFSRVKQGKNTEINFSSQNFSIEHNFFTQLCKIEQEIFNWNFLHREEKIY